MAANRKVALFQPDASRVRADPAKPRTPVPKKSNLSAFALLKTANVPIRVTESSARKCTKKGDYGDSISRHSVASIWKHNG